MNASLGRLLLASGRTSCCRLNINILNLSRYGSTSQQYYGVGVARRLFFNVSKFSKPNCVHQVIRKQCTGPPTPPPPPSNSTATKKLSLYARFKAMYKDYWYVLVPVHVVTSIGWFGVFYKVSISGVDIGYYLRKIGVNETVVKHITESSMGHIAVAWALYKVATPARYAVTLGGTTLSINVLRNMGYIKPAKELMAKGRDRIQSLKDKQLPKK